MQSGFVKFAIKIIGKDWERHGKVLLGLVLGMMVVILLMMRLTPGLAFAKGVLIGVGIVVPYGFAQLCFFIQRQHGLLKLLMTPAATPVQLVLAKFASAFSMALFIVNIPGILFGDLPFLFYVNVGVLLMTSVCMAIAVISDLAWASLVPLWIVLIPYLYARPQIEGALRWSASHGIALSVAALCLIPIIVYGSALKFEIETRRP